MTLSISERDLLRELCPFWYSRDDLGENPHRIISVTRKYFKTEHLDISISSGYKEDVYKNMKDFKHHKKILIVEQYNQKYKSLRDSLAYFDEFREQNPEYFT